MDTAAADERTAHHRFLDHLMLMRTNSNLREFVMAERRKGQPWRLISSDVRRITDEDVSPPTLIAWFAYDQEFIAAYEAFRIARARK